MLKLWQTVIQQTFATGQEQSIEFQIPTMMGLTYYASRIVPEFAADGSVKSVLAIARNISDYVSILKERDRVEEALRQSEAKLYLTIKAAKLGIWECAVTTGKVFESDFISDLYGLEPEQKHQTFTQWLAQIHPDDQARVQAEFNAALKGEAEYDTEFRILRPDNSLRWTSATGSVMYDQAGNPLYAYGVAGDITERKLAEQQLQASLKEKEVLLKEVHHRVKNNLQIIYSMLRLQQRKLKDPQAAASLLDSQNRIDSIALLHEKLYRTGNLAQIDFTEYIPSLVSNLLSSYSTQSDAVTLETQIEPITLDLDRAIPCGLIINELVSNALKYAFPESGQGTLQIELRKQEKSNIILIIKDNGIGMPKNFNLAEADSLGLQLVDDFVAQLKGTITMDSDAGTTFRIVFPDSKV
jgi:PAS domain S-box-containing protein